MARTYAEAVAAARDAATELVLVERGDTHALVTMNDPDKLNPLSAELTVRLREALTELAADESLRAIILTGADPAFSAGGDLRLMRDTAQPMLDSGGGAPELWRWIRMEFGQIARLITRTDKAFVAAVNGAAAGVGLAFALACDLILVSDRARLVPAFGESGCCPRSARAGCSRAGSATSAPSSCSPAAGTCREARLPRSGSPTRCIRTPSCCRLRVSGASGSRRCRSTWRR